MVVPVYRVAGTIEACLQSVAEQTMVAGQVILVDDAGGDESMEIAVATAERLNLPYEVVAHRANAGLGAARNSGLALASGEYVWFLDSDDTAEPTFLADLWQAVSAAEADFAICRTRRVAPDGTDLGVVEDVYWRRVCPGPDVARELLRGRLRAYACNKIFRTELLGTGQLGEGPFPVGQAYEDFVPVLKLALDAQRVAVVNRPLYRYRDVPSSISNRFGQHTLDLLRVSEQLNQLFTTRGDTADFAADLLVHHYRQVLLPIANMALRSAASRGADDLTCAAVATVRGRIRSGEIARLARIGELRLAAAAAVLAGLPSAYTWVLQWR